MNNVVVFPLLSTSFILSSISIFRNKHIEKRTKAVLLTIEAVLITANIIMLVKALTA